MTYPTDSNAQAGPCPGRPIVFFDGTCGLCNRWVDWIIRIDRDALFVFAPLQGDTAKASLSPVPTAPFGTLVLVHEGRRLERSDAVLQLLHHLGGGWRVLSSVVGLIPRLLRDFVYDTIARNRFRWFARLPARGRPRTEEEHHRFLR